MPQRCKGLYQRLWASLGDQSFIVWLQIQAQRRCANLKQKWAGTTAASNLGITEILFFSEDERCLG